MNYLIEKVLNEDSVQSFYVKNFVYFFLSNNNLPNSKFYFKSYSHDHLIKLTKDKFKSLTLPTPYDILYNLFYYCSQSKEVGAINPNLFIDYPCVNKPKANDFRKEDTDEIDRNRKYLSIR